MTGRVRAPRRRSTSMVVALVAVLAAWFAVSGGAVGAAAPATVTVDGAPIGSGGSRIASCTFEVGVDGLPATVATDVRVIIAAVGPTVPEGTQQVLVDETAAATGPTWQQSFPMDALVAPFDRHPNGYHLQLAVQLDGAPAGEHTYWLGCGDPQTGHPTRVQLAVEWHRTDGSQLASPYDAVLPEGWRAAFRVDASSDRGTATCTYDAADDVLDCTYDNPGHGSHQPGLVVQGNPRATYDVAVAGTPDGWVVDPATVGTFVGRETCPRDEGATDPAPPCVHVVVLDEQAVAPTTTTTTTAPTTTTTAAAPAPGASTATTPAPAPPPTAATAGPAAEVATGTLPATGRASAPLAALGLALVLAGSLLVRLRRASEARSATGWMR